VVAVSKWGWSDSGNNKGLSAGEKRDSSGNGTGTWWSRSDGSSGQSQTNKDSDTGVVTHWQHDRNPSGNEEITETTYFPDGSTHIEHRQK
jgi:hypothetical protein